MKMESVIGVLSTSKLKKSESSELQENSSIKYRLAPDGLKFFFKKGLTRREVETVEALLATTCHQEAADKLCISLKTLKFHLTKIYRKLGVKNQSLLYILIHQYVERKPQELKNGELPIGNRED